MDFGGKWGAVLRVGFSRRDLALVGMGRHGTGRSGGDPGYSRLFGALIWRMGNPDLDA